MHKILFRATLCFVACLFCISCARPVEPEAEPQQGGKMDPPAAETILPSELGNPVGEYFKDLAFAKCIWEVFVYEDKLYLGCGDGNSNTAPTPIFAYDLTADAYVPVSERWKKTGEVMEEWVERFYVLDGKLICLGADPAYGYFGWDQGTYYSLETDGWQVHEFEYGPHTYDITKFEGAHFIAKKTLYQGEPVIRSTDGGKTWENVGLFKDGVRQTWEPESIIEGDKFITLNGRLYLWFYNSGKELGYKHFLYEYREGAFHQLDLDWPQTITVRGQMPNGTDAQLSSTAEFQSRAYLVTGHLMVLEDVDSISQVSLPENCRVQEVLVQDDRLYVMASTKKSLEEYETLVFVSDDGETFEEAARFAYPLPMYSFAVYEDVFYFGTGSTALTSLLSAEDHEKLGTILSFPNLAAKVK